MINLVQQFLRNGGTIADLATRYFITGKRHAAHPNLVLLKYNQIESPFSDPLVQHSRGVILDESNGWAMVAWPFNKFFNHGEGNAAVIDWTTARVQEKVDGSLCVVYFYDGDWHVATTGTPDACGVVNAEEFTFRELFWQTAAAMGLSFGQSDSAMASGVVFFFELTTPFNKVVVQHKSATLTLLGARFCREGADDYGRELTPRDAMVWLDHPGDVLPVREFPLQSIDDVLATFSALSPLAQEGYVIVDSECRRIKVKHPGYVHLHHLRDSFSPRAFVEIARTGETSEVLTAFPEFAPTLADYTRRIGDLCADTEAHFGRLRDLPEQKAFALEAVKTRFPAALFLMRRKGVSARAVFAQLPIDSAMALINVRAA